jgi:hypothetical protein
MKIGDLTKESIDHVFDNLWHRCADEIMAFGQTTEQAKEGFVGMIGKPFSMAFMDDNLVPFALVIVIPQSANRWRSNFVYVKDEFIKNLLVLADFLKTITDDIVEEGIVLELFTIYGKGGTHEWFTSMGLRRTEELGQTITKYEKTR